MRGSSGLVDGVVRSVGGVGLCVDGLVGPDVRVAEKIAGRDGDVMERGDIVNSSQVILRSLGEIRRFATVSGAKRRERREALTQMPLPVSILRVDPCGVCLLHERIPVSGRVAARDGDERGGCGVDGNQSTYTISWSRSLRWRYFS
jgi:hypothetical protein